MAQLAIYLEDQLAKRLDKAVKASGQSKSRWVAKAIERSLQDHWPDGFFDLAGKWQDDKSPEEIIKEIREGIQKPEQREKLF
jgi:predicted transcriptional regulator